MSSPKGARFPLLQRCYQGWPWPAPLHTSGAATPSSSQMHQPVVPGLRSKPSSSEPIFCLQSAPCRLRHVVPTWFFLPHILKLWACPTPAHIQLPESDTRRWFQVSDFPGRDIPIKADHEGRRKNGRGKEREEEIAWVIQLRSPIEALGEKGLTSQTRYNLCSPRGR